MATLSLVVQGQPPIQLNITETPVPAIQSFVSCLESTIKASGQDLELTCSITAFESALHDFRMENDPEYYEFVMTYL